jgi:hypothetical protein
MSNTKASDSSDVEIPNTHVAEAAHQFRAVSELLFRQLPQHDCVLPLLMVAGFAIELSLKSLNSRNVYHDLLTELGIAGYRVTAQPIQKGHSLVQLFDALEERIQRELQEAYVSRSRFRGKPLIRDELVIYDTVFVNSRYPFGAHSPLGDGSINGLVDLVCIIDDHIQRLKGRIVC